MSLPDVSDHGGAGLLMAALGGICFVLVIPVVTAYYDIASLPLAMLWAFSFVIMFAGIVLVMLSWRS